MITPLLDYVVIKEIPNTISSEVGIIIPEGGDIPYSIKGEILAIGDKVTMPLKVGDIVLFKRYGFEEIVFEKVPYLVGKQENVYAKC